MLVERFISFKETPFNIQPRALTYKHDTRLALLYASCEGLDSAAWRSGTYGQTGVPDLTTPVPSA